MKNFLFAFLFTLSFIVNCHCAAYAPQGYLFVTMLDIGQGDSFLIETPEQNISIIRLD